MNAFTESPAVEKRNSSRAVPKPTIADTERLLAGWTDLAPAKVRKLRTALATAARCLAPGEPPQTARARVVMDCPSLSRLLQTAPATFGLSPGRMTSLCSELRYILRRLGRHEPDRRGQSLTAPDLRSLFEALPRHRQLGIVDFLRHLDADGIALGQVDDATLAAYETRCAEHTLCADPAARGRQVASTWNWAHQHVPHGPTTPLGRAPRVDRYTLPWAAYPAGFRADLARYAARLGGQDIDHIFTAVDQDGAAPRRPLRTTTINNRIWMLRCAAAALVATGTRTDDLTSLRDLVDPPDHAKRILKFMLDRRGGHSSRIAAKVGETLHLLARDHCGLPAPQVATIATWAKRVRLPENPGLTEKNARRLRALMQQRARAMLLHLPLELMRRAAMPGQTPKAAARLAMHAAALEILLICPMRRDNLAGLRIDQHLHRPDPRQARTTHILLDGSEVKNGAAIHWPIPPESAKLIETYLKQYRHHIATPGNPFLFPTGGDRQRTGQQLGLWLSAAVEREIGVAFNLHLARHFAAWNFLRLHPGQYEVVRQVLGHRNIRVTIAYYVGLEADSAARHFDATVLRDRQATKTIARAAFHRGAGGVALRNGGR